MTGQEYLPSCPLICMGNIAIPLSFFPSCLWQTCRNSRPFRARRISSAMRMESRNLLRTPLWSPKTSMTIGAGFSCRFSGNARGRAPYESDALRRRYSRRLRIFSLAFSALFRRISSGECPSSWSERSQRYHARFDARNFLKFMILSPSSPRGTSENQFLRSFSSLRMPRTTRRRKRSRSVGSSKSGIYSVLSRFSFFLRSIFIIIRHYITYDNDQNPRTTRVQATPRGQQYAPSGGRLASMHCGRGSRARRETHENALRFRGAARHVDGREHHPSGVFRICALRTAWGGGSGGGHSLVECRFRRNECPT